MNVDADVRFAIVPEWVIYAPVSANAVRLYAVLARHADKDDAATFVSRATLARKARVSADTVDRALKELLDLGALIRTRRRVIGSKENDTNLYTVISRAPEVAAPVPLPSRKDAGTGGRNAAARGGRTRAAENESPLNERSFNEKRAQSEAEFEAFWASYPKRVGKGQARRAFKAARAKVDLQTLGAALEAYCESVKGSEARFIAHPATWLNGERWTDEAPVDPVLAELARRDAARQGVTP